MSGSLGVQITSGGPSPVRRTLVLDPKTYAYLGYRIQCHGAQDFEIVTALKASGVVDLPGVLGKGNASSPAG